MRHHYESILILGFLVCIFCSACYPSRTKVVAVEGKPGLYMRFSTNYDREDDTDVVFYEIIDGENNVIKDLEWLVATGYNQFDLDSCRAKFKDGVVCMFYRGKPWFGYDLACEEEVFGCCNEGE